MRARRTDPSPLTVVFQDGRSGQAQQVSIWIEDGMLQLVGQGLLRQIPLHQVQWSDQALHPECIASLPEGAALHADDQSAWLRWRQQAQLPATSAVLQPTHGWRWSLMATLLLLAICATSYVFALPRNLG